jgi:hypothetical protein
MASDGGGAAQVRWAATSSGDGSMSFTGELLRAQRGKTKVWNGSRVRRCLSWARFIGREWRDEGSGRRDGGGRWWSSLKI